MRIRNIENKDIPFMLEWMKDKEVVEKLHSNFREKTYEDCLSFVENAISHENIHLAIVSDEDEYMGTVSLKHINYLQKTAEFAITVRRNAMGKGYAWYGMLEILKKAFVEYNLECVYWCVATDNVRACRFYDKHGFHKVYDIPNDVISRYKDCMNLQWYSVLKGDDYSNIALSRGNVSGCKIINIETIPTLNAGELSFFESGKDTFFEIKRIYYISKVPEGTRRGFHAHRKLKQLLFCPYGKIQLILDDGEKREEITLNDPSIGILIERPVWREMLWLEKNSVLCVAASEYYDTVDYIRDYSCYLDYIKKEGC